MPIVSDGMLAVILAACIEEPEVASPPLPPGPLNKFLFRRGGILNLALVWGWMDHHVFFLQITRAKSVGS